MHEKHKICIKSWDILVQKTKNAIEYRYIDDCPTKIANIEIAEDIFGKDIHALKGKTVRKAPV